MKQISESKISEIKNLYSKYKSLRAVSRIMLVSPNTVKKYASHKFKVKTYNLISKVKSKNELLIGTYIGLWMGDGTQYYDKGYCIKICSNKNDESLNNFIQKIIFDLFGKNTQLIKVLNTNQAYIRLYSKYIFNFIYNYINYKKNKTHTVQLKNKINCYNQNFLNGVLLGITLSDGYIKDKFMLNLTSQPLSQNIIEILENIGFHPKKYIHKRNKYGWKDLHMVRLNRVESQELQFFLNKVLKKLHCQNSIQELKNYNSLGQIASS